MIDSSKLLSRTTSKRQSLLSRESVTNLIIIKRDTIKIDGLLKERLVLSKAREGVLKRRMENEMRRERERNLEARRETNDEGVSPESNKKPKSILGTIIKFLFGGFLKLFSGLFIKILPRLPFLIKSIAGFSKFFLRTLTGSFRLIGTLVARGAPLALDALKGVSKTVFTALTGLIKKTTLPLIVNAVKFLNTIGIGLGLLGTRRAITGDAGLSKAKSKTTEAVEVLKKQEQLVLEPIEMLERKIKQEQPLEMAESKFGTTDQLQKQKKFVKQKAKVTVGADTIDVDQKNLFTTPRSISKKISPEQFTQGSFIKTMSKTGDMVINPKLLTIKNKKIFGDIVQESLAQRDLVDSFGDLSDVELRNMGFDPDEIKSNRFAKAMKDAAEEAVLDEVNAPRKTVKASKLVGKKGISRFLVNAGGETLEQSVKQSIKQSVGFIPIIGDLIGVLLDVYLFGEPLERAVFKGVGSFALGALLAGVGTFLGGPVGTLIGSIIGGIGGDILGGIAYDLFFGKKVKPIGASTVTGSGKEYLKGVSKARGIQKLNDGGLVARKSRDKKKSGIDPRILELYPELDPTKPGDYIKLKRKTLPLDLAIESQAFYEKSVGREIIVPIPIPIPSTNSQAEGGLSITVNTESQKRNTFSQLYRRG